MSDTRLDLQAGARTDPAPITATTATPMPTPRTTSPHR